MFAEVFAKKALTASERSSILGVMLTEEAESVFEGLVDKDELFDVLLCEKNELCVFLCEVVFTLCSDSEPLKEKTACFVFNTVPFLAWRWISAKGKSRGACLEAGQKSAMEEALETCLLSVISRFQKNTGKARTVQGLETDSLPGAVEECRGPISEISPDMTVSGCDLGYIVGKLFCLFEAQRAKINSRVTVAILFLIERLCSVGTVFEENGRTLVTDWVATAADGVLKRVHRLFYSTHEGSLKTPLEEETVFVWSEFFISAEREQQMLVRIVKTLTLHRVEGEVLPLGRVALC
ncbi:MAG: uncharacterized protein A8A55_1429 [Amphiamblys sp. WSBS2006]|nr:MAG: uncharacterized protein A8A55_1429 [Amphiamblys sp. WSBS2006]